LAKHRTKKNVINNDFFKSPTLTPKNEKQADAIRAIIENQITFLLGPAGTGKSVLAAYSAIQALKTGSVHKIILTRPVVEAGNERLGYLPGTFEEKIHPYLIPLYDEIFKFATKEELFAWKNNMQFEICPLALMRGRNFHNAFIILDEAQNCSEEQLVMALTRFGMNSKMVITGDPDQSDLPLHRRGALSHICYKLDGLHDVGLIEFDASGIVRNPLITSILERLQGDESP
jgi:phosphate starvation-inducible PhoH-like protein